MSAGAAARIASLAALISASFAACCGVPIEAAKPAVRSASAASLVQNAAASPVEAFTVVGVVATVVAVAAAVVGGDAVVADEDVDDFVLLQPAKAKTTNARVDTVTEIRFMVTVFLAGPFGSGNPLNGGSRSGSRGRFRSSGSGAPR